MTPLIIYLLATATMGLIVARHLTPPRRPVLLAGTGILLGAAIPGVALALLSLAGLQWSLPALVAVCALVVAPFAILRRPAGDTSLPPVAPSWTILDGSMGVVISIFFVGYISYAMMGPVAEYDFIGIWGVKARAFLEHGGIDLGFLQSPWNAHVHSDYPILLPLQFASLSIALGRWDDTAVALFNPLFGGALLLVAGSFLREEGGRAIGTAAILAMLPWAFSPYLGLAEGPLMAYGTAGVLIVRYGVQSADARAVTCGAILLGLAASTKNEGLTLLVASAAALALDRPSRRFLRYFLPGLLLVIPWVLARVLYGLTTDLTEGSILPRVLAHLSRPDEYLRAITAYPLGRPLFWTGMTLGLLVCLRRALHEERLVLTVLTLQYASYAAAYLITPHDLDWHIQWSWERVINQMTPLLAFVVLLGIARTLRRVPLGVRAEEGVTR